MYCFAAPNDEMTARPPGRRWCWLPSTEKTTFGLLCLADFRLAFTPSDQMLAAMPNAAPAFVAWEDIRIPQQAIAELAAAAAAEGEEAEDVVLTADAVQSIKVKPRLCESFVKVWDTRGTLCQLDAHIWAAAPSKRMLDGDKVLVPVGHYITDVVSRRPTAAMIVRLRDAQGAKVRKTSGWPRSWANFSLS